MLNGLLYTRRPAAPASRGRAVAARPDLPPVPASTDLPSPTTVPALLPRREGWPLTDPPTVPLLGDRVVAREHLYPQGTAGQFLDHPTGPARAAMVQGVNHLPESHHGVSRNVGPVCRLGAGAAVPARVWHENGQGPSRGALTCSSL